jgi:type IV secretion system protein VirB1
MNRMLILLALALEWSSASPAQRLTLGEFRRFEHACVPEADDRELLALARTESNLYRWALSVNRPAMLARRLGYRSGRVYLKHQPQSKAEAIRWTRELEAAGLTVSVGILQVNRERSPYSAEQLLDPCRNLQEGWRVFGSLYGHEVSRWGEGQRALLAAFGAYNAGSPLAGFRNGYVWSILQNSY